MLKCIRKFVYPIILWALLLPKLSLTSKVRIYNELLWFECQGWHRKFDINNPLSIVTTKPLFNFQRYDEEQLELFWSTCPSAYQKFDNPIIPWVIVVTRAFFISKVKWGNSFKSFGSHAQVHKEVCLSNNPLGIVVTKAFFNLKGSNV